MKNTKLDDDFRTVWSHLCLNHDRAVIETQLTALAELGQINAVQSHYLVNGDDNPEIKRHIINIQGMDPGERTGDQLCALSHFQFSTEAFPEIAAMMNRFAIDRVPEHLEYQTAHVWDSLATGFSSNGIVNYRNMPYLMGQFDFISTHKYNAIMREYLQATRSRRATEAATPDEVYQDIFNRHLTDGLFDDIKDAIDTTTKMEYAKTRSSAIANYFFEGTTYSRQRALEIGIAIGKSFSSCYYQNHFDAVKENFKANKKDPAAMYLRARALRLQGMVEPKRESKYTRQANKLFKGLAYRGVQSDELHDRLL